MIVMNVPPPDFCRRMRRACAARGFIQEWLQEAPFPHRPVSKRTPSYSDEGERERERESVCVCVCVREREEEQREIRVRARPEAPFILKGSNSEP